MIGLLIAVLIIVIILSFIFHDTNNHDPPSALTIFLLAILPTIVSDNETVYVLIIIIHLFVYPYSLSVSYVAYLLFCLPVYLEELAQELPILSQSQEKINL